MGKGWIQVTRPTWRDLSFEHTSGRIEMKDPFEYARIRFKQNIIANLQDVAFQRQTGRTFRLMLQAIEMSKKGMRIAFIANNSNTCSKIADILCHWMSEAKVSPHGTRVERRDGLHFVRPASSGSLVTLCTPRQLQEASKGYRYDIVLFDNSVTDSYFNSPTDEFTDLVRESYGMANRKDMMSELRDAQGRSWSIDSLLLLPGSDSVGSLISITRAGFVPMCVSVLHEGQVIDFPVSACDFFIKPGA
jgi:hypothetical protein